jgi:hypothetical protein
MERYPSTHERDRKDSRRISARYQHEPLNFGEAQIRLFKLSAKRPGQPVGGTLQIVDLEKCPAFPVLSYRWGSASER